MQSDARATWLLGLGAAIGLSVAAGSLLVGAQTRVRELSSETVATVNGVPIQTSQFLRAVEGLASDRREALSEADRVHVLDRLIEEELLVQHALDLGLAQRDRRTRSYLVSSVLDSIVAETEGFSASPGEVQDFYAEHGDYFARPGRLRVQQVFISLGQSADAAKVAAAQARGEAAAQRLRAGEDLAVVQRELGDREIAGVPNVELPPVKLREYLGPSVLEIAQALESGAISEPVRSPQGLHVLWMIERQEAGRPALADVEAQVLAEMKRRAGDQALRQSLDDLRAQAAVVVSEPLP
jgi:parvulin-like peptidyl-prolyl isomerase